MVVRASVDREQDRFGQMRADGYDYRPPSQGGPPGPPPPYNRPPNGGGGGGRSFVTPALVAAAFVVSPW